MPIYRKKPDTVEAWKISDEANRPDWIVSVDPISDFIVKVRTDNRDLMLAALTSDYVVRERCGVFRIVPGSKFEEDYELVEEPDGPFKPCPFCKSHRISGMTLSDSSRLFKEYVCCDDCGASTTTYETRQLAMNAWNKRAR